jgi:hypothetical protein
MLVGDASGEVVRRAVAMAWKRLLALPLGKAASEPRRETHDTTTRNFVRAEKAGGGEAQAQARGHSTQPPGDTRRDS